MPLNCPPNLTTEADLVSAARALIGTTALLSDKEQQLIGRVAAGTGCAEPEELRALVMRGLDPRIHAPPSGTLSAASRGWPEQVRP